MNSNKTLKHILVITASNCTSIISGIVIGFLVPKMLSVGDYGMYKTFTLYMTYAGFFSLGIIDGIILDYGGLDFEQLDKRLFRGYWRWYLYIHSFFLLLLMIVSITISNTDHKYIIIMLGINMMANNFTGYFQQISQITLRFGEYSFRKVLQSSLNIAAVVCLYVAFVSDKTISYKIYIDAIVIINIVLVLWYFFTYKEIIFGEQLPLKSTFHNVFHLMGIGFPLLFANLSSTLILTIDRQFVNILFDTSTYAVYAFAYNMLSLVTVATSAIATVIYPILKRSDKENLKKYYTLLIEIVLIFVFFAVIAYFPLCLFIKEFLPKYTESLIIFRIIFPGLSISTAVTVIIHNYYKTLGKNLIYFKKSIFVLLISGIANSLAYFVFRNTVAISVASIITMVFWYLYSERYFVKLYSLNPYRNFLYLVSMMITFYVVTSIPNNIVSGIVYIAVFGIVTCLFYWNSKREIIKLLKI